MKLILRALVDKLQAITSLKQEHFLCLTYGPDDQLIAKHTVFIGSLTSVLVHPREVFAAAIEDHAAFIVVAHNHPSGNPAPSENDIAVTEQLEAAGEVLGIPLEDHIIVGGKRHFSFQAQGLLSTRVSGAPAHNQVLTSNPLRTAQNASQGCSWPQSSRRWFGD